MNAEVVMIKETELLGRAFSVYGTAEEPLFLAKDVAEMIEHQNITHLMNLVEDNEKLTYTICNSGQNRQMWFLTEDGLYEVLMQSRKKIAKEFKRGVKQILKEIRKEGGYIATSAEESPELIMAKAIKLAELTIKRKTFELECAEEQIKEQKKQLAEQAPKVLFASAVETSKSSCLIGELAKILCQNGFEVGQNRLFKLLRDGKYLMSGQKDTYNLPYQRYVEQGLFEIKKNCIINPDGSQRITSTTKVTGKGQAYFINKFLGAKKQAV